MSDERRRDVIRLSSCSAALVDAYDVVMFDLDGVVYRGPHPIPGVPAHLARLRTDGVTIAFVTNNAARTPEAVVEHLAEMGVGAVPTDIVTSAQAVARLIAERLPAGSRVLTVGGDGLVAALAEHGLVAVNSLDDEPAAVVQGFSPAIDWRALAEATYGVNSGLPWYASNTDLTIPTARGTAPGNGTLVAAVRAAVDVDPIVAGKPEEALFDETVRRVGGTRPLVVGDRLDTDIEGANRVGADSLLVLTGVSRLVHLVAAPPRERPGFVAPDLDALFEEHPPLHQNGAIATCDGWAADVHQGAVRAWATDAEAHPVALLRVAVATAWQHVDTTGQVPDMEPVEEQLASATATLQNGRAST